MKFALFDYMKGGAAIIESEKTADELREEFDASVKAQEEAHQAALQVHWELVKDNTPAWAVPEFEFTKPMLSRMMVKAKLVPKMPTFDRHEAFCTWVKEHPETTVTPVEELTHVR